MCRPYKVAGGEALINHAHTAEDGSTHQRGGHTYREASV